MVDLDSGFNDAIGAIHSNEKLKTDLLSHTYNQLNSRYETRKEQLNQVILHY